MDDRGQTMLVAALILVSLFAATSLTSDRAKLEPTRAAPTGLAAVVEAGVKQVLVGFGATGAGPGAPAPECADGIDNDGDTFMDYVPGGGGDPDCFSYDDPTEGTFGVCADGGDNDGDGRADANDPGCVGGSAESPNPQCSDGLNNADGDSWIDYPVDRGCQSPYDTEAGNPQCSDGLDNDNDGATSSGDGLIDYPADPGCAHASDNDETNPACNNGRDDDGDLATDFPGDQGCGSAQDNSEGPNQCRDGMDNNGNGFTDFPADIFNCSSLSDPFEGPGSHPGVCGDGFDNDGDGLVDYPADPGCSSLADTTETTASLCDDGVENDSDGRVDGADPGCALSGGVSESPNPQCSDNADNDGDTRIDYPADFGCTGPFDHSETPEPICGDGLDNDGDSQTDYPNDPGCTDKLDNDESDPGGGPLPGTPSVLYTQSNLAVALRDLGRVLAQQGLSAAFTFTCDGGALELTVHAKISGALRLNRDFVYVVVACPS